MLYLKEIFRKINFNNINKLYAYFDQMNNGNFLKIMNKKEFMVLQYLTKT